jgi:hypothetical protein
VLATNSRYATVGTSLAHGVKGIEPHAHLIPSQLPRCMIRAHLLSLGQKHIRQRQPKPPRPVANSQYAIRCIVSATRNEWSRALHSPDSLEASALHGSTPSPHKAISHVIPCQVSRSGPFELLLELLSFLSPFL